MYVQRTNLPHAIRAGSFESSLTALTLNIQSNYEKKCKKETELPTVVKEMGEG